MLFVNEHTGVSGLSIDVSDPKTLFAACREVVMHAYVMLSGGNSSGLDVSNDSGTAWKRVEAPRRPKLPHRDRAVAPSRTDGKLASRQFGTRDFLKGSQSAGDALKQL